MNHSILTNSNRQTSELTTLGRNLMYNSILTNALRQTYLYM